MTDKRQGITLPPMSKAVKKMRPNEAGSNYKENIDDVNKVRKIPAKTTYFFQPTNTLEYRKSGPKETKDKMGDSGTESDQTQIRMQDRLRT